jgi:radical SAM-linked protein
MWSYRIKYSKKGIIRFISHLDTMRALKRALSRVGLPVAYSEGFNPRPKMSMGPPLPLGCESNCEISDIVMTRSLSPKNLVSTLGTVMPRGLDLLNAELMNPSTPKLSSVSSIRYMIELPVGLALEEARALVQAFEKKDSALLERIRKGKQSNVNVRSLVVEALIVAEADSGWLSAKVGLTGRGTCSPVEVARTVFGLSEDQAKCLRTIRTEIIFGNSRISE